ncbi:MULTISPECIES: isochorismate lyase [Bradyrhizobium]|mgnify:CR=1 FL=1|jgi:isochorismate pyruvate lyase|uniref:isochorismate lyase n=1 Tax=Bradyrhizobium TaxID=374 RepID=UPI00041DBC8E|nr:MULTISPECIES: isochorismate lyase [Bradyrhizobium]AUC95638.1 isochorismate-pyruvate lyase [Bradyrhizobium sp. SK17]KIU46377.1 isochorismate-pyruvate lyase [Bradyrhizobium elkanii]MBK5652709.1 isochorismate lyase [Rhizobium sp.]OCX26177.1 isochorismate-pyruvate lyase [Bradyrhizobium sp. UASWS1016]
MPPPKAPECCENLGDIREGLDDLDRQIVAILKHRMAYVRAAAQFKPTEESIPAPERVAVMLADRRAWADAAGLPADGVEMLFAGLIQWFIDQQVLHWRTLHGVAARGGSR